ncbi:hypothetical protein CC1G_15143 [Coprinopsis cinerea okayama7|uniref:Uncharacterized protein n=1 Tax=Coprinopsis cinerea (strain Okayama-7 / 130 / ATCC MYA-4618 / FGSC 9003) TaxID=240176 RepID=D6RPP7_COPC7|nr:hypothetical protein CC1G_15143 [Coprinopsis cinerea okayama7\|eukprot:XP_002910504.1 hypothetical protein CC1G_15143 [Coprinopsis cinerea okayama7\
MLHFKACTTENNQLRASPLIEAGEEERTMGYSNNHITKPLDKPGNRELGRGIGRNRQNRLTLATPTDILILISFHLEKSPHKSRVVVRTSSPPRWST